MFGMLYCYGNTLLGRIKASPLALPIVGVPSDACNGWKGDICRLNSHWGRPALVTRRREWLFIVLGLAFAILVIALPSGSFWKNVSGLTLGAIVLLAFYPIRRR